MDIETEANEVIYKFNTKFNNKIKPISSNQIQKFNKYWDGHEDHYGFELYKKRIVLWFRTKGGDGSETNIRLQ